VNQEDERVVRHQHREKAEWSKGYGTDAPRDLRLRVRQLRLERIELDVHEPNARAQRSYEKAGFVTEGTLRHAHFSDGRHHDVLRMSLLRGEWEAQPHHRPWDDGG
jgi:RimJ/RimL family protein N-acetyltransferase